MRLPTIADVHSAAERIALYAVRTPLIESHVLNDRVGGRVLLKLETLQRVGAFKFRGAYNKISRLNRGAYPGGVVACSSGNHAQGVALAASLLGFKAVIVMPRDAPAIKIARTKALGAEVILFDRLTDDRVAIANALVKARGAALVLPFDDLDIIAGQGTAGLEIVEQVKKRGLTPDLVLVPCSGGGLASGIAIAVRNLSPTTVVSTVEPSEFDDFKRSLQSGKRERNARLTGSICDALLVSEPGEITFAVGRELLSSGYTVSEEQVRDAIRFAFEELKLVVEPGGAVALASVLFGVAPAKGKTTVVVLSGGNIDPLLFAEIIA
jgi:threonine dehydratase